MEASAIYCATPRIKVAREPDLRRQQKLILFNRIPIDHAHGLIAEGTKGVTANLNGGEKLDKFPQDIVADCAVVFRQSVRKVGIVLLDILHRLIEGAAEVRTFGQGKEILADLDACSYRLPLVGTELIH
jgi:hypothetical protein